MSATTEILIPSVIITVSNIFSHEYGSQRYKNVTAIFGWTACGFLTIWTVSWILSFIFIFYHMQAQILKNIEYVYFQILCLSATAAISRDYEGLLKPLAPYFEIKVKYFFRNAIKKIIALFSTIRILFRFKK